MNKLLVVSVVIQLVCALVNKVCGNTDGEIVSLLWAIMLMIMLYCS